MVTRLVDSKAHQTRLEECEKKHHEGKLKQAPTASNLASSSDVHSFTQKKKPMTHPVQKTRTPPPVSPSSSPSSSHSSSSSSSSSNDKTKTRESRLALPIICEEEEEEEMTTNLRVGFYERHRKNLPKSIAIDPSSSKKAYPTPNPDSPSRPTLLIPTAAITSRFDEKLLYVGDIPYHEMRKPFVISRSINEELFECRNHSPLYPKVA